MKLSPSLKSATVNETHLSLLARRDDRRSVNNMEEVLSFHGGGGRKSIDVIKGDKLRKMPRVPCVE